MIFVLFKEILKEMISVLKEFKEILKEMMMRIITALLPKVEVSKKNGKKWGKNGRKK